MKPVFPIAALAAALALAGASALAAQTASGSISAASQPLAAAAAAPATAPAPLPAALPAPPAPGSATGSIASGPSAANPAATDAAVPATPEQQAALAGARPAPALATAAAIDPALAPSTTGSLLTTIFSLILVLGLLVGLAWLLKRFGPKTITGGANVKLVGALSVGARERILVVEVGQQWIVVGASPGRMNALATLPRQENASDFAAPAGAALPGANFAEWFKQTIEKRNGK